MIMKRLLVTVIGLLVAMSGRAATEVYVAPGGQDGADGSVSAPVATLQRAAELAHHASGGLPVTVHVAKGRYFMDAPLRLSADDSYVTWQAEPGAVLTGARLLKPVWKPFRDGIYVAAEVDCPGMDQLFVNGRRQVMARYPNVNPAEPLQGACSAGALKVRSARWAHPETALVRALHDRKWGGNSYRVTGRNPNDATGLALVWVGDNNRGSDYHRGFVMAENVFEELDAPGEWFYDAPARSLYYKPADGKAPAASAVIEAAVVTELIRVQGGKHPAQAIVFDGFTLERTARTLFTGTYVPLMRSDWCVVRSGALFLENTASVVFRNGRIRDIGGNAVFMSGHNTEAAVIGCDIEDIGSSGVLLAGHPDACREPSFWSLSPKPEGVNPGVHRTAVRDWVPGPYAELYPRNCEVSDCHIRNVGIWEKQSSHVAVSVARGIRILGNTIHVGPRAGINVGDGTFGGHEIAYNDVFDVQLETDDHGMFNAWGRDRFWSLGGYDTLGNNGEAKSEAALLDCIDTVRIHDNRMHFGGRVDGGSTFGIDLDDGSSNYAIYNNLCLNMGIKLREGFRRRVFNNILVGAPFNLHCTYARSFDSIRGNIVVCGKPYELAATDAGRFRASGDRIEANLFWNLGAGVQLPDFWDAVGYDRISLRGGSNPGFRDPAHNDYTVTNRAAAEAIGFVNFPMNRFGCRRAGVACPVFVKTSPDSVQVQSGTRLWQGAELQVLTDALMSSSGAGGKDGAYVASVAAGSPAATVYGLRPSDVIRQVNGNPVVSPEAAIQALQAVRAGQSLTLGLVRNQRLTELRVVRVEE